tara:strand:+ start:284 stop:553 length:270 start_codon:yes stop_codon:yes gene_type:complete
MDNIFSIKNIIILSLLLLIFLTIKDDGAIDYYKLSTEHTKLLLKEKELEETLNQLKQENRLLRNNNQYIEKIARENFFYLFPNETIIHF